MVVNRQSGVVVVRAMPSELRDVADYLAKTENTVTRQVVLEAKIVEVELSDAYQAGINWAAVLTQGNRQYFLGQSTPRGGFDGDLLAPPNRPVPVGPGNPWSNEFLANALGGAFTLAADFADFNAFIELLGLQGRTRVLSSPRVSTLHNQKAIIKAGTDEFFVTGVQSDTTTGEATTTTVDVELTPFFSGVALDVTPQINDQGDVLMHIHPTVSDVTDQQKELSVRGQTDSLPLALSQIRESDSIVRARSGQVIVIGGLMRETRQRPGLQDAVPRRHARARQAVPQRARPDQHHGAGDPAAPAGRQRRRLAAAGEGVERSRRRRWRARASCSEREPPQEGSARRAAARAEAASRPSSCSSALDEQKRSGRKLGRVLTDMGLVREEKLNELLAANLQIPFIDVRQLTLDQQTVRLLPEAQARRFRALVLQSDARGLLVGMADPDRSVRLRRAVGAAEAAAAHRAGQGSRPAARPWTSSIAAPRRSPRSRRKCARSCAQGDIDLEQLERRREIAGRAGHPADPDRCSRTPCRCAPPTCTSSRAKACCACASASTACCRNRRSTAAASPARWSRA